MAFAVVPAFNEREHIRATVKGLLATPRIEGVLVVDDGSRDGTAAAVASMEDPRVMFSRTRTNRGKGAALNHGMRLLDARDIDIFVFCDADLGETAAEVVHLLEPVIAGRADLSTAVLPPGDGRGFGMVVRLARWGIRRA
ncbi:MAG: glycosyltransferase family 2 protein, partial [Bacillota bacterium]